MMEYLFTHAGLVGLLFFFVFFLAVAIWVFRPGARGLYQNHAMIPFREGQEE